MRGDATGAAGSVSLRGRQAIPIRLFREDTEADAYPCWISGLSGSTRTRSRRPSGSRASTWMWTSCSASTGPAARCSTNWMRPRAPRKSSAREYARADEARRAELKTEHEKLDARLRDLRDQLAETNEKLNALMLLTPTIPWPGAPVGPDESANVVIRTVGTPPEFGFRPLDHVELLEKRGWADFARARKVAGERAYALISDLVLLERAVLLLRPRRATRQGLHAGQRALAGPGGGADRHRHVPGAPRGDLRDPGRQPVPGRDGRGRPGRLPRRRDPRP